jgi:hypothetical protein
MYDELFGDKRGLEEENKMNEPLTRSMWALAIDNAKHGISNIIESPMTSAIQGKSAGFIDDALKKAKDGNFKLSLIYCVASAEVVLTNLKKRNCPRDLPKYDYWQNFVQAFIDVPGPTYEHLRIDSSEPIEKNLELITHYLSKK